MAGWLGCWVAGWLAGWLGGQSPPPPPKTRTGPETAVPSAVHLVHGETTVQLTRARSAPTQTHQMIMKLSAKSYSLYLCHMAYSLGRHQRFGYEW